MDNSSSFFQQILIRVFGRFEWLWADGKQYPKPISCSAPAYMELLMNWIEELLADTAIFPTGDGECRREFGQKSRSFPFWFFLMESDFGRSDDPFPKNFLQVIKAIFK